MSRRISGFTLVEMLVALTITSLVMTLLMGATFYILQVREKLANEVADGEQTIRTHEWFRQLVHGILPVDPTSSDVFEGDAKSFRALLMQSLSAGRGGAPEMVELRIVRPDSGGVALQYKSFDGEVVLASWTASSARFEYLEQTGKTFSEWKSLEHQTEICPRAIGLQIEYADGRKKYLFARVDAEPWVARVAANPFFAVGKGGGSGN